MKRLIIPTLFLFFLSCGNTNTTEESVAPDTNTKMTEDESEEEGMIINVGELTGDITYTNIDGGPTLTTDFVDINLSRWADRNYEFPIVDEEGNIEDMYIEMGVVESMIFSGCTREEMDAYFEQPEEKRGDIPRVQVEIKYTDGTVEEVETYASYHCIYYNELNLAFDLNWCDVQKLEFGPLPWDE